MTNLGAEPRLGYPLDALEMDLRHLPAPEPMLRILQALPSLAPGRSLVARTPYRPQPLLDRLQPLGYRVEVVVSAAGDAWVHIVAGDGITGD